MQISSVKEDTKIIRKALKKVCPTLSIRMARGTAYGWIDIQGSKEYGAFTEKEKKTLTSFVINYGGNFAVIRPRDREYYREKAEEILKEQQK